MSFELVYTSAPKGLKAGSRGFCTVAYTEGMPKNCIDLCESISGYAFVYSPQDADYSRNPVAYSHYVFQTGGTTFSVLSRVAAAGTDYTGRSNKLAHHVMLEERERGDGSSPAWAMDHCCLFRDRWTEDPHLLTVVKKLPEPELLSFFAQHWEPLGDPGWAGVLARQFLERPDTPVFLLFEPGVQTLPLIEDAIWLLPPEQRWRVTFNTYFTVLPRGTSCAWRCCLPKADALRVARQTKGALVIDLTRPLGPVPREDALTCAARNTGNQAPDWGPWQRRPGTATAAQASLPRLEPVSSGNAPAVSSPKPAVVAPAQPRQEAAVPEDEEATVSRYTRLIWGGAAGVGVLALIGIVAFFLRVNRSEESRFGDDHAVSAAPSQALAEVPPPRPPPPAVSSDPVEPESAAPPKPLVPEAPVPPPVAEVATSAPKPAAAVPPPDDESPPVLCPCPPGEVQGNERVFTFTDGMLADEKALTKEFIAACTALYVEGQKTPRPLRSVQEPSKMEGRVGWQAVFETEGGDIRLDMGPHWVMRVPERVVPTLQALEVMAPVSRKGRRIYWFSPLSRTITVNMTSTGALAFPFGDVEMPGSAMRAFRDADKQGRLMARLDGVPVADSGFALRHQMKDDGELVFLLADTDARRLQDARKQEEESRRAQDGELQKIRELCAKLDKASAEIKSMGSEPPRTEFRQQLVPMLDELGKPPVAEALDWNVWRRLFQAAFGHALEQSSTDIETVNKLLNFKVDGMGDLRKLAARCREDLEEEVYAKKWEVALDKWEPKEFRKVHEKVIKPDCDELKRRYERVGIIKSVSDVFKECTRASPPADAAIREKALGVVKRLIKDYYREKFFSDFCRDQKTKAFLAAAREMLGKEVLPRDRFGGSPDGPERLTPVVQLRLRDAPKPSLLELKVNLEVTP